MINDRIDRFIKENVFNIFNVLINICILITFIKLSISNPIEEFFPNAVISLILSTFINLFFKPKLFLSKHVFVMTTYTFLGLPILMILIFSLLFNNIYLSIVISILTIISTFFALLRYYEYKYLLSYRANKKSPNLKTEFLNKSKIAFDIIRFIFLVILTLSTIYGKLIEDFSLFLDFLPTFKKYSLDEIRNYFQMSVQILTLPFIFSSTLLRIVIDHLLLKKK